VLGIGYLFIYNIRQNKAKKINVACFQQDWQTQGTGIWSIQFPALDKKITFFQANLLILRG